MKDKLNWKECMKRKCEQCKYYDRCFKKEGKKMSLKNDKEEIKELAEIFESIADTLNEAVKIQDKLDNNELDMSKEEADEKVEEILGKFIIKLLKAQEKLKDI